MSDNPKRLVGWTAIVDPWSSEEKTGWDLVEFSSEVMGFEHLPEDGMQGLIKFFADGTREMVSGYDWYLCVVHPSGETIISGSNDRREELETRYPGVVLKRGKLTTDAAAYRVNELLMASKAPALDEGDCG